MALPRQVQEAEARSNQAIEEFQKGAQPPAVDPPSDAANPPAPSGDPPPAPAPAPTGDGQPREDWKAKYHVLQGKYNAEVPRLHHDLRSANERIESLAGEVAALKSKSVTAEQPPAPQPIKLPPELVAAVGEDAAAALVKVVAAQLSEARTELGKDIAPVRQQAESAQTTAEQVAATAAATARDTFMAKLGQQVPDWQKIDEDEAFHQFLAQRDPFARQPRQKLMAEAYRDGDVDAVAAFFTAFKATSKPADPPAPTPEPTPTPAPAAPAPNPLAKHLTPDTTGRSSVPTDKKIWTQAEIKETYKQIALGKIPADKANALEQDIVAAGAEGRIR